MDQVNLLDWYHSIPPVTRVLFTASMAITAACALDMLSPFSLYYNYSLIWERGEVRKHTVHGIYQTLVPFGVRSTRQALAPCVVFRLRNAAETRPTPRPRRCGASSQTSSSMAASASTTFSTCTSVSFSARVVFWLRGVHALSPAHVTQCEPPSARPIPRCKACHMAPPFTPSQSQCTLRKCPGT